MVALRAPLTAAGLATVERRGACAGVVWLGAPRGTRSVAPRGVARVTPGITVPVRLDSSGVGRIGHPGAVVQPASPPATSTTQPN